LKIDEGKMNESGRKEGGGRRKVDGTFMIFMVIMNGNWIWTPPNDVGEGGRNEEMNCLLKMGK
jgi:hypothetical protein